MTYTLTEKQYAELEGLAHWISNKYYARERYPEDKHEQERCHKTILLIFDVLDKMSVPFWVQNTTICWAEEWRNVYKESLWQALERRNIHVA